MKNRLAHLFFGRALAALLILTAVPSLADAQSLARKLDSVLRDRATRLAGSSRVSPWFARLSGKT